MARAVNTLAWPLEGSRVVVRPPHGGGESTIVRTNGGAAVGRVGVSIESDRVLLIEGIEIEAELRGYGLGSEAARLVLDAAVEAGFREVRAWAPPDRGLAVYFWFRMGLRPVFGAEPRGGLAFVRGS